MKWWGFRAIEPTWRRLAALTKLTLNARGQFVPRRIETAVTTASDLSVRVTVRDCPMGTTE